MQKATLMANVFFYAKINMDHNFWYKFNSNFHNQKCAFDSRKFLGYVWVHSLLPIIKETFQMGDFFEGNVN